ncbi:MAG: Type I Iterative PKS [Bathelium mastoideum]|nr:MAG: Type I Iterative PKS [Bathelium mastoideum]
MAGPPSMVVFGPLSSLPKPQEFARLKDILNHDKALRPLLESVSQLHALWELLVEGEPDLHGVSGELAAKQLADWTSNPPQSTSIGEQGNIVTLPMTIISQIAQYFNYLQMSEKGVDHGTIIANASKGGGIQGCCAGLLCALAVASARTKEEIARNAIPAVEMAFCIGAYIDLDQARIPINSKSSTIAIRWKPATQLQDIERVISNHDGAYLAVTLDIQEAAVTVPNCGLNSLMQDLCSIDVSIVDTLISGRYHSTVHAGVRSKILDICKNRRDLHFETQELVRSNFDGEPLSRDRACSEALDCILTQRANWCSSISKGARTLKQSSRITCLLSIGINTVPQSISKHVSVIRLTLDPSLDLRVAKEVTDTADTLEGETLGSKNPENNDHAIAIVGMSCKVPGANSLDEFWNLLTEGRSMLSQLPTERYRASSIRQPTGKPRFWGNFLNDIDVFDHKFFRKSAKESATMDPQQRILLQCAYEALECSGYFSAGSRSNDTGCYIGSCSVDYDTNVASNPPTAYSSTGTLRAFLSGRISHFFGWSGPSITFDTACSSSAVAVHTACTALRAEECSFALAGGISLLASPYLFENLSAARFTSPTGASKPFDKDADGYCRGEGVGLLALKRLPDALKDNDTISGIIVGSALNQNHNSVPITVPHSGSQQDLYHRVLAQARISSQDVTFVEAHGPGTSVGDSIEMETIRSVFGGPERRYPLYVSSLKGNIGHLEGASGVLGIIKAVLQMEHRIACIQASHTQLNTKIKPLEPDMMCIPASNRNLPRGILVACVNNYGAAGSNAAIIITQMTIGKEKSYVYPYEDNLGRPVHYPIQIAAASEYSVISYCQALDAYCRKPDIRESKLQQPQRLQDLAFNLARRCNYSLPYILTFTTSSLHDLQMRLQQQTMEHNTVARRPQRRPLVLCFGGQVSEYANVDINVQHQYSVFKVHLDSCHTVLRSMGHSGLYPWIFEDQRVTDVVALHAMLFSVQYSCARSWLDSGLQVDAVIGHSLGQLTAICISGSLSLRDSLKFVVGRARLIRKHWSSETGSMIAAETDLQTIYDHLFDSEHLQGCGPMEIACHNGPKSHVIVSDQASAENLSARLTQLGIKWRKLNIAYGFHSRFTDVLIPHLEELASSLEFNPAELRLETCTKDASWPKPTARLVATHTRDPVYFCEGVRRLQEKLGECTWLEAGSDSGVISMTRKALRHPLGAEAFFPISLRQPQSVDALGETTVGLWNLGHSVDFWKFHRTQGTDYKILHLPSYQFERHRHWLSLGNPTEENDRIVHSESASQTSTQRSAPSALVQFEGSDSQGLHYIMNSASEEYLALVNGHIMLESPLCPMTLYVEAVIRVMVLSGTADVGNMISIRNMVVKFPLGVALGRTVRISLQRQSNDWEFHVTSEPRSSEVSTDVFSARISHATGLVSQGRKSAALQSEFLRFEKLVSYDRLCPITQDPESDSIQGNMLYNVFSHVVKYAEYYRGVRSIASRGIEIVGKVSLPKNIPESIRRTNSQPHILDSFLQVVGLYANCIRKVSESDVFCLTKIERLQYGPEFEIGVRLGLQDQQWDVLAIASNESDEQASDLFVYDSKKGKLAMIIFGATYIRVPRKNLKRSVSFTTQGSTRESEGTIAAGKGAQEESRPEVDPTAFESRYPSERGISSSINEINAIREQIFGLLEKFVDTSTDSVRGDVPFDDLGIDSLAMIEIAAEISRAYDIRLSPDDLSHVPKVDSLIEYLQQHKHTSSSQKEDTGIHLASRTTRQPITTQIGNGRTSAQISNHEENASIEKMRKIIAMHLETDKVISLDTNLFDHGLDSLRLIELIADINRTFSVAVNVENLGTSSTLSDFLSLVLQNEHNSTDDSIGPSVNCKAATDTQSTASSLRGTPSMDSRYDSPAAVFPHSTPPSAGTKSKRAGVLIETLVWKQVGAQKLRADLYLPSNDSNNREARPVALMIHGGGHVIYGREDIPMKHIRALLQRGFLPVSIDYRLCPEVSLLDGPVTDCCDALRWVRQCLGAIEFAGCTVRADSSRVLAIGWSSGGHLAMTLGCGAAIKDVRPPEAVLAFYPPADLESKHWDNPCFLRAAEEDPHEVVGLLDGVKNEPIVAWVPVNKRKRTALSLTVEDERARILLHMNWTAQTVPILIGGLPSNDRVSVEERAMHQRLPKPAIDKIRQVSPYWHILQGDYRTPTFIVHGNRDECVPCEMSQMIIETLLSHGVTAEIHVADQCGHAFDLFPGEDELGVGWQSFDGACSSACREIFGKNM